MSRRRRVDFEGAIHHVMNRGVDRQTVFFDDADRVEFGQRLKSIHVEFGVETLAYCLMDNHYHLLLHTPHAGLSAAMQQLGSIYTRHTNDRLGRDGPLFRGRFHAIQVTNESYLAWVARYIHRNPLALSGIDTPRAYRWSSYRAYLGLRRCPPFLRIEPVMIACGGDGQRLADFTEDACVPNGHGSVTVDDLHAVIQLAMFEADLFDGHNDADRRVLGRTLLIATADALGRPHLTDAVHDHLETPSPTARRMALSRARARRSSDPAVRELVRRVVTHFEATAAAA